MESVIRQGMVLGFLLVFSIQDVRTRQISKMGVALFLIMSILGVMTVGMEALIRNLPGGFLGGLFVVASYVSGGKIGMGDGLVLLGIGLLYGMEHLLFLICVGCLQIIVIAVCVSMIRRINLRNRSYPFVPCLFVGEVLFIMGRYFY